MGGWGLEKGKVSSSMNVQPSVWAGEKGRRLD